MDHDPSARRPLKSRSTRWAAALAGRLADRRVSPNAISLVSILFAALAGACLVAWRWDTGPARIALPLAAAAFVQLRLLCNLLDGMVAVEGGLGGKAGDVYNELPDRIADPLILAAAGYAIAFTAWGPALGWAAAVLALLTAYVRALGASLGASQDFRGPMAKPHRMFAITLGCFGLAAEAAPELPGWSMIAALVIIVAGAAFTLARRAVRLVRELESR